MKSATQAVRLKMARAIESVWRANLQIDRAGLAPLTWGNASQADRARGLVAIKPSGVAYDKLKKDDIVLTDMKGEKIASGLRPSSDLPSHLALYRAFPSIGAVVHTHSACATAFAQACRPVPCLGTTHADYCHMEIPVTSPMPSGKISSNYEANIGESIVRRMRQSKIDPRECPFILVASHGPFTWGRDAAEAVENAIVLEQICQMALWTVLIRKNVKPIRQELLDKHFFRKHGRHAYYGQEQKHNLR
ncbi:MAG: L-ribulose-5-phosphate 4-epimerase AraD [Kiritimatiellia bacterium]